jgi:acetate kinase
MNVFVINSGSSSIKYQLIQMPEAKVICSGLIDRIGQESSIIQHKTFTNEIEHVHKESSKVTD